MSWIEALILGILQGLTEYLPVSSSGHLAIGSALFGIEGEEKSDVYHRGACGNGAEYAGYLVEGNRLDIPRAV